MKVGRTAKSRDPGFSAPQSATYPSLLTVKEYSRTS